MASFFRTSKFITSLGETLSRSRAGDARQRQLTDLNSRSDVELADMGLVRSDLARHVFRDIYYI